MARTWDSWTGAVTPATMAKAREIVAAAARAGHTIQVVHGKVSDPSNTEHYSGRALDFMTFADSRLSSTDRAIGDWVAAYLWRHRDRLGLRWMIWRQRIRSTSAGKPSGWQGMADRGSPTNNHMDHVHAYFTSGPYRPPAGSKTDNNNNTDTDWLDDMFKNVSEFKKAVIDAVRGDRYPAPKDWPTADTNPHWTLDTYLQQILKAAQRAADAAERAEKAARK